ncbi:hypothetical protein [Tessaracoccus coleopterorum]|uniref:hypothetical protein n=1 Tax=Tessaracoccus coleopterorum TaxID=2714950 RepID=UPI001E343F55|nr:hypothetical protein [Tessaracoccus coleopterorum]
MFDTLTRCAISLRDGNYPAALGHCAGLDAQGFPRFEVLAHVYAAAAQIRLENPDAARDELALGWRQVPSPRLLRFALRFVPADITERLVHIVDTQEDDLPRPLREALEAAAGIPDR